MTNLLTTYTNIKINDENVTEVHLQILGDLLKNFIEKENITDYNELNYFLATKFDIFDSL
jgi:hypothetical protein